MADNRTSQLDISVIVCTRDRADSLNRTLCSFEELALPASLTWELVIVDNGSSDNTHAVAVSHSDRLPIQYLFEDRPGLSNARNRGVRHARGKHIIWTDDDVYVCPDWLNAYVKAFIDWPDCALFGGKITPILLPPTPQWFRESQSELGSLLAARDFGEDRALNFAGGELPFGANFAIRADYQLDQLYDPSLGVAPGRRTGGEEFDVMRRVLTLRAECRWVSRAELMHIIPSSRQTVTYLFNYFSAEGELYATLLNTQSSDYIFVILSSFCKLPFCLIRYFFLKGVDAPSWVNSAKRLAWHLGVVRVFPNRSLMN